MSQGDVENGWKLVRARVEYTEMPPALCGIPLWNGEEKVDSLLVWWREGAGIGGEVMRLIFIPKLYKKTKIVGVAPSLFLNIMSSST
ncbi:hypothetical protein [Legionella longbeachae]|uniref:hypothetical protein n=1 Tax=Legionella longbeachae TaxID=450 RepID=UPI001404B872|nr:hypothetical protein [Legionella longbeachae]QIN30685.1 hypothetical protein GCB94_00315 [Legionella longbeachae]